MGENHWYCSALTGSSVPALTGARQINQCLVKCMCMSRSKVSAYCLVTCKYVTVECTGSSVSALAGSRLISQHLVMSGRVTINKCMHVRVREKYECMEKCECKSKV